MGELWEKQTEKKEKKFEGCGNSIRTYFKKCHIFMPLLISDGGFLGLLFSKHPIFGIPRNLFGLREAGFEAY